MESTKSPGKVLWLIFFFLFTGKVNAEINRYVVYFTDKENNTFTLAQPHEFLSERSITRRLNQNIPLRFSDLPVTTDYIQGLKNQGAKVFYRSRWLNAALVEADDSLLEPLKALTFVQKIEFVAPGSKLKGARISRYKKNSRDNDFKVKSESTAFQNQMLGVDLMHGGGYKGQQKLIGVFDGGFINVDNISFFDHLFLENRILSTHDFVTNDLDVYKYDDHGTNVFSCLAAFEQNSYVGTAFGGNYVLCVTEDIENEYRIEEYNWLFAAEYADSIGVEIINSSLGYNTFDDPSMNYTYQDLDGKTAIISKAAKMAAAKGMVVVASAGNEGNKLWKYIVPPADADSIISVGAVDNSLTRAFFSSVGPTSDDRIKPEVAALGLGTRSIGSSGNIILTNGTSLSTPLITGFVAGVWQKNPHLTNMEVIELVKNSGSNANSPDNELGYGIPDFSKIPLLTDQSGSENLVLSPNPTYNDKLFLKVSPVLREQMEIRIYNLSGQVVESKKFINPVGDIIDLETTSLKAGMYILAVESLNTIEKVKFIKF